VQMSLGNHWKNKAQRVPNVYESMYTRKTNRSMHGQQRGNLQGLGEGKFHLIVTMHAEMCS